MWILDSRFLVWCVFFLAGLGGKFGGGKLMKLNLGGGGSVVGYNQSEMRRLDANRYRF